MSIVTPTNFNVQNQSHIDSRLIQADIASRDLISEATRYFGMFVHVIDSDGSNTPNTYILQKGTTSVNLNDNGNWVSLLGLTGGILNAHVQLSRLQIQNLATSPIEVVTNPGSGKYIQVIGGSAKLNYIDTIYGVATRLHWEYGTTLEMVQGTTNWMQRAFVDIDTNILNSNLGTGEITPVENVALNISADADATGDGGTIDVYIQYTIIDTN